MKNLLILSFMAFALVSCGKPKKITGKSDVKPVEIPLETIDIQLIRNATLKLNYNGKMFLVDPSLSPKNSFMSFVVPNKNLNPTIDLPMSVEEITKDVEAILVTHTHLDHFDEGAKEHLNPNLPLFGQPFDKEVFEKSPFKNVTLIENKNSFKGVTIIRTGGKHGPEPMLEALGEVSGFILQAKDYPSIYIVGDCLLDDEIKENIKKYNPDIIVLNTGGAVFGGATILMTEKNAVEVAKLAPNAKVITVHMESLDHCKITRQMVRDEAKKGNVEIIVPDDGETIKL